MQTSVNSPHSNTSSRRRFLRYSLATVAGAALLASGWWWLGRRGLPPIATHSGLGDQADTLLASLHGVSLMGDWAKTQYPILNKPLPELVGLLRQRLQLSDRDRPDAARLQDLLQQAVREDFTNGKVILVNGWQLSETETVVAAIRWHVVNPAADAVEQPEPREAHIATITHWGPQQTFVGQPANEQSGGYSALWFDSDDVPRWAQIAIDGVRLDTFHRGHAVVVSVRGKLQEKLLAEPGEHVFTLHDDMNHTWQTIGTFKVLPKPAAPEKATANLCKVTNWGPRATTAGTVPNPQKNGEMGLWIDIACVSESVKVRFGETLLAGYFNGHAITCLVPGELLQQAGRIPLALVDTTTDEVYEFGEFVINNA